MYLRYLNIKKSIHIKHKRSSITYKFNNVTLRFNADECPYVQIGQDKVSFLHGFIGVKIDNDSLYLDEENSIVEAYDDVFFAICVLYLTKRGFWK